MLGAIPLLFPVLWTWGLEQNTVGDAFTALQLMLYDVVFPWFAMASFLVIGVSSLFWFQLFIMVTVLVFAAYIPRSWCKYFCPHGAIMAILNRFSFLGLRRDLHKCPKGTCRLCVEVCPMRVPILDLPWEKFSHPECIYCLKCVDACPHGAIKLKYP
jgi:polyferredoxin